MVSLSSIGRAARTAATWLTAACFTSPAAAFHTSGGKIYDEAGSEVVLRGISHTGFNNNILQPQYLWVEGWKDQIARIKSLGFTAVRLPLVPDVLYNTTPVEQLCSLDRTRNADLYGKTPVQVLDLWMAEADRQGLYVVINMYSIWKNGQTPTWFVTNPADYSKTYKNAAYTESDWIHDLAFLADRYKNLSHFIAIDPYNEPNGLARWSTGGGVTDPAYFWKRAVEAASASILAANPNLLVFVEGIPRNYDGIEDSSVPTNWGEDLQPQRYQPLDIPAGKLVLTPHTYGPDVYWKSTFSSSLFPSNLAADWDKLFGTLYPSSMLVIGEWGGNHGLGPSGATDTTWENAFVDYMISRGIANAFWWAYAPNGAGTGGIIDDSLNVRTDKMAMLNQLWAATTSPTMVASSGTSGTDVPPTDSAPPPVETSSGGSDATSGGSVPADTGSGTTSDVGAAAAPSTGGAVDLPLLLFCVGLAACARRRASA